MRVGIDIGGTFTDIVILTDEGNLVIEKTFTTQEDLTKGVVNVITKSGLDLRKVSFIFHATTQGSNAVIEGKGAKTALITTKGFRDILEIRRGQKTATNPRDTYNLQKDLPQGYFGGYFPLVERRYRYEINERTLSNGEVLKEVEEKEVLGIIEKIKKEGIESVAIVYLFSFLNPNNELKTKNIIKDKIPDLYVSASFEVAPIIREYERTSTTVINAYIGPLISRYLNKLIQILSELNFDSRNLYVMQSNGGLASIEEVKSKPVFILESGPTAGVAAARWLANLLNIKDVISFDMGGTTAKAAVIKDGEPLYSDEFWVEDKYFVAIPHVDLVEVGAGGGSIAWIDKFGALRVGPLSAAAYPGPICYDRGGTEPTVTDADLILGYIDPEYFAGGEIKLNVKKTQELMKLKIADKLKMSLEETALSIIQLANVKMSNAIRLATVRKGYDPEDFTMIAFGGAGPVHATFLAKNLGIKRIVIPVAPANFSALGLLVADLKIEEILSKPKKLYEFDQQEIENIFRILEEKILSKLVQAGAKGDKVQLIRYLDMRYEGQVHELTVKLPNKQAFDWRDDIANEFAKLHKKVYGYDMDSKLIEVITFRSVGIYPTQKPNLPHPPTDKNMIEKALRKKRRVFIEEYNQFMDVNVYLRELIPIDVIIEGPAVIEEKFSSVIVPPNAIAYVDELSNLIIEIRS